MRSAVISRRLSPLHRLLSNLLACYLYYYINTMCVTSFVLLQQQIRHPCATLIIYLASSPLLRALCFTAVVVVGLKAIILARSLSCK